MDHFFLYSFLVINLFSLILYGLDKYKAKKNQWRISELTLIIFAFIAPFGAFIGMQLFKHKTQKWKFKLLIPLFILLQIALLIYFFIYR